MTAALSVCGLGVRFHSADGVVAAVTDVSFELAAGELLALVGESGCGKSVLATALLGLLPGNAQVRGEAWLGDVDLLAASEHVLARRVRGRQVGWIPQSPASHLTPVRTVRAQLAEALRALGRQRSQADGLARRAGLEPADLDRYPHELSGGLAQRAANAIALAGDPRVLLADEPTNGLDRPLVWHTMDALRRLADDGHAVLLITHDLDAVERAADRVAVMYAGRLVEITPADHFFTRGGPTPGPLARPGPPAGPRHPYAQGLLHALPDRGFTPIPGLPPELTTLPAGCAFAPRCPLAWSMCAARPALRAADADAETLVACHAVR
ncbi:MAG: ABC transporter ATP-binding protein [Egibacteraceae bacterium]